MLHRVIQNPLCVSIFLSVAFVSAPALAEPKTAVADNGREVILKENGKWEYANDDIYATTPDGERVRLQPDQSWQKVDSDEAPVLQPVVVNTVQRDSVQIDELNARVVLDTVVIENQRETVGKNKRLRSNLVFYLDAEGITQTPAAEQLTVQDSRGRDYPVFAVTRGTALIGQQPRLIIRAKGAPRWWGVKFFNLTVAKGAMGNSELIELRKSMNDVLRKEVTELPEDNL